MVPVKIKASLGITVIFFLRILVGRLEISSPSINIFPVSASNILNNDNNNVDFPEPVLPIIAIYSIFIRVKGGVNLMKVKVQQLEGEN